MEMMLKSKWGDAIDSQMKYNGKNMFKSFLTGMMFGAMLMSLLLFPQTVKAYDANGEVFCMAKNIYFEAGNQPVAGKVEGATHYHADTVYPYWADSLNETVIINNHIFYK